MLGSWEHDRNKLFLDDKDRERFLERLKRIVQDFEVRLFAFCLMSNHFHLLDETPRANLSKFMQSLNCTELEDILKQSSKGIGDLDFRVTVEELLRKQRGTLLRPIAARMLVQSGGCTQREIATIFGLATGAAVSQQLKRVQELELKDQNFKQELDRLEDNMWKRER